jgi:hypothetical protein
MVFKAGFKPSWFSNQILNRHGFLYLFRKTVWKPVWITLILEPQWFINLVRKTLKPLWFLKPVWQPFLSHRSFI